MRLPPLPTGSDHTQQFASEEATVAGNDVSLPINQNGDVEAKDANTVRNLLDLFFAVLVRVRRVEAN